MVYGSGEETLGVLHVDSINTCEKIAEENNKKGIELLMKTGQVIPG
jgi:hypothetical protein